MSEASLVCVQACGWCPCWKDLETWLRRGDSLLDLHRALETHGARVGLVSAERTLWLLGS